MAAGKGARSRGNGTHRTAARNRGHGRSRGHGLQKKTAIDRIQDPRLAFNPIRGTAASAFDTGQVFFVSSAID